MGDLPWNRIERAGRRLIIARPVTRSVQTGLDSEIRFSRVRLFKDERIEGGWVQGKVRVELMQGIEGIRCCVPSIEGGRWE